MIASMTGIITGVNYNSKVDPLFIYIHKEQVVIA
jgi:hypothetical protein